METTEPWEHPDWYDLHDTAWTAGPDREPEHYRETIIALPPLDAGDHLVDVGAGTGKLALLIARSYPRLGAVTLIDPNAAKLERARERLTAALPGSRIDVVVAGLGIGAQLPQIRADIVTIGSVLMPTMELRGGTLADGMAWLNSALADIGSLVRPGGWLYDLETLAAPWARGGQDGPVRRLTLPELDAALRANGFSAVECTYRFRDRVVLRARR